MFSFLDVAGDADFNPDAEHQDILDGGPGAQVYQSATEQTPAVWTGLSSWCTDTPA